MQDYNQNQIPHTVTKAEEHHRLQNMTIIVVTIAIVFGLLYWWTTSGQKPVVTQSQPTKVLSDTEKASSVLANSPVISQQDVAAGTATLKSSKVIVTQSDIQAATKLLQAK